MHMVMIGYIRIMQPENYRSVESSPALEWDTRYCTQACEYSSAILFLLSHDFLEYVMVEYKNKRLNITYNTWETPHIQ